MRSGISKHKNSFRKIQASLKIMKWNSSLHNEESFYLSQEWKENKIQYDWQIVTFSAMFYISHKLYISAITRKSS